MEPDTSTKSTERGQAILAAMQEEMRRVVLGEMRTAGQLATLADRAINALQSDLDQWAAEGRILSVRHESVDYFSLFALNPADGYRGGGLIDKWDREGFDLAFEMGKGGVWLRLTDDQYQALGGVL